MIQRSVFSSLLFAACVLLAGSVPALAKEMLAIQKGSTVKLHYTLKSEGKVVDTSKKKGPLEFALNEGTLWPAFEENILGMKAGEKKRFELRPEEAFGLWDAKNIRVFPRSTFSQKKLKPGMELAATRPGETQPLIGRVTKVVGDQVGLDFNHHLAGKTLQVKVKILEVRSK